jgi:hypothetical protein
MLPNSVTNISDELIRLAAIDSNSIFVDSYVLAAVKALVAVAEVPLFFNADCC